MKNKLLKFLSIGLVIAVLSGCGAEPTVQEANGSIEASSGIGSSEADAPDATAISEPTADPKPTSTPEPESELNLTEYDEGFFDLEFMYNAAIVLKSEEFEEKTEFASRDYYIHLTNSIDVYDSREMCIGYTKPDAEIVLSGEKDEWYMIKIDNQKRFIKIEDVEDNFRLMTADEIIAFYEHKELPDFMMQDLKNALQKTENPSSETSISQNTGNNPVENSTTQESVETPVVQNPTIENPVEESVTTDKYTPDEAIAVYRSIMEEAGIIWNPEIKEEASWGTGFIELRKGGPEWSGNASVDSFINYGNGDGIPWTQYYLEVTGYDENYVYITAWHA